MEMFNYKNIFNKHSAQKGITCLYKSYAARHLA